MCMETGVVMVCICCIYKSQIKCLSHSHGRAGNSASTKNGEGELDVSWAIGVSLWLLF